MPLPPKNSSKPPEAAKDWESNNNWQYLRSSMPKLKKSTDADWLNYYEDKCRRQHKEIMALKRKVEELEAQLPARKTPSED